MYNAQYWTVGRGGEELNFFRQVLRRYRWEMKISLEEGEGAETWFPPTDDLPTSGISLYAKHHGFWSTLGQDNHEIVDASPEALDRHLAALRPLIA
jgi:hypothetical protein